MTRPIERRPLIGVTVMPEYFQVEGVDAVLDNLARRAGVTAIATSPYVMGPALDGKGSREPPIDAGAGSVRLLDRPLWGRRELFVRTAPSWTPDQALYRGLRYQPADANDLTAREGAVVARTIKAAKARGLLVLLQVQTAIPPGYRVQFGGPVEEDRPRLPDGSTPAIRVDNNASLASPHIHDYARVLVADLMRAYPDADGIRIDWPEYPPYSLDSAFFDFGPHAAAAASARGYDFDAMRNAVSSLRSFVLGQLGAPHLAALNASDGGRFRLTQALIDRPALAQWLAFKADLSVGIVRCFRDALDQAAPGKLLVPGAFPPPWTALSGFSFARAASYADAIMVKLFTMHWPMMIRAWGDAIVAANPSLAGRPEVPRILAALFDIVDGAGFDRLQDWRYPEPEEPHPVGVEAQMRKIALAQVEAGSTPIIALAHGYGPVGDFEDRFRTAWNASDRRVWVNRYGYLADAKLDAIGRIVRKGGSA
ncbi:MAG: hypothetical protein FJX60_17335 [Alphaproteobacteria bacterium]|nr:hypothetical protein [Alphaproteobacteria bacterium]